MENQISLEQIDEFKKIYNSEKTNKIIENAITKNGLENACINRDIRINQSLISNCQKVKDMIKKIVGDVGYLVD